MTLTVDVHEAKAHLSRLVDRALRGEDVVIAEAGRPRVRLVVVQPADGRRALGALAGTGTIPDDIDAGFAADIDVMFHGGSR